MIAPVERIISQDTPIGRILSELPHESSIKITISGVTGILMNETTYDGLMETIRILHENPTIVHSLNERESGEFVYEENRSDTVEPFSTRMNRKVVNKWSTLTTTGMRSLPRNLQVTIIYVCVNS